MGASSISSSGDALAYIHARGGSFRGDARLILGHSCAALMPYREAYIIHVPCIMYEKARVRRGVSPSGAAALNDSVCKGDSETFYQKCGDQECNGQDGGGGLI